MAFQVSPGVNVTEIDLTTIVPAVSTTVGAIAGNFNWGPVEQRYLITNENQLINVFGEPNSNNQETFFTAANFLNYGNALYVSRAASSNAAKNAVANSSINYSSTSNAYVKNINDYTNQTSSTIATNTGANYIAKYPGALGNSLKISICDSANAYNSTLYMTTQATGITAAASLSFSIGNNVAVLTVSNTTAGATTLSNNNIFAIANNLTVGDYIVAGNTTIGTQFLKLLGPGANTAQITYSSELNSIDSWYANTSYWTISGNTISVNLNLAGNYSLASAYTANSAANSTVVSSNITRYWEFYNNVDRAPGTSQYVSARGGVGDEIHIVITDENGAITGTPNVVLETYKGLSRATDSMGPQGGTNFYQTVINNSSNWVWWIKERTGSSTNTASNIVASTNYTPFSVSFFGGADSLPEGGTGSTSNLSMADLTNAYNQFAAPEDVDISLVLAGKAAGTNYVQVANWLINNIAETRKDCMVFISPNYETVVNNSGDVATSVVNFRNALQSSSYAVVDSGYKYFYDRYNDKYIYVPLNGDIAGTVVRTDSVRDPWFSPAGYNRGQIKNVIKLPFNPNKAQRDLLYKNDVNPVVNQPGTGVILFGDKTALGKPSAFDRINVRRLFIVLEKAIATAAKFTLFEFNDVFTRAQFRNLVEPYLRDIQGRRGIYDFKVVCDETNNTPERIDINEFWGDIYIKPARSINFIQLNFVAVRTGVQFSEVVGQF